ncbi:MULTISPECIES: TFIIB-type zinc ribbon-containing protein [unclassified Enterococcus]|uniref:TFIIB-type zinc ribbon-containing protein n=1 Tax=unclassified Enterococcus TaxID=2608891 RepID=UPI001CE06EA4|nr:MULTISPECIES: TFIIB-type zinc ribbon-containing protein [unclassified Enterococcus]MCA5012576.1 TFIIB-type zinc ribbon-containing protein [Enterococcus sp. S23]MCA5015827.1 TFIIB-type zinc ribbon-containing protein [Enterococcus sp. S22(2020)]
MTDTFTHKCPNCDGPLLFDPKDQKFHCEYCLNVYTETEVTAYEQSQRDAHLEDPTIEEELTYTADAKADRMNSDETAAFDDTSDSNKDDMELFNCPSCGAQIVTEATTAATYCYYCHNPVVLSGRLSGTFLPEKVLPFAIEKEEAVETFLAWTKKKWFIPKDFFNKEQIDKLTGVYFPYWVVDADINGQLNAMGTTLRVWRVGDLEYTETKQFEVTRQGKISFKELIKNALSKNTQQKMVETVQPFPIDKARSFKSQYLAGFQAEKRDIEYEAIQQAIQNELKDYSESLLRDTAAGYTSLTKLRTDISLADEKNHYMLLPIWLVTYRSNEQSKKVYYFAMNGQTGKVSGILPVSYKRLGLFTFGLFSLLLALFLIGGWFI